MGKRKSILIVGEDLNKIAESYNGNSNIDYAKCPKEAEIKIGEKKYDLVLWGYNGNGDKGLEVLENIRRKKDITAFLVCEIPDKKNIEEIRKNCGLMRPSTAEECLRANIK